MTFFRTTFLLISVAGSQAFIFNAFSAFPALKELAKLQTDTEFCVRFDIGNENEKNHLSLDGLELECFQTAAKKSAIAMPGADGPHPQTSSGKREVHISRLPFYVGMKGQEQVTLENAAWEMIWKADDRQGALLLGFDNAKKVVRNDHTAHLPAGRIYISFPIWTQDLLSSAQENKATALERRDEHAMGKDRCLSEMQATGNLFKKAMLYRDAAEQFEKMDLTGWRWYQWVPDSDGVVPMGEQVLIGQQGAVWSKGYDRFSPRKVLGKATIRLRQPALGGSSLRP